MFFFQAEDGIRDLVRSRGLGDVYKRQVVAGAHAPLVEVGVDAIDVLACVAAEQVHVRVHLSLIPI